MKCILIILILTAVFINVYSIEYYLRHDDADSNFDRWYGALYRANKYYVSQPCTIFSIEWGRNTRLNETDTLFIWQGDNDYPANLLYEKAIDINSNRNDSMFTDTIYNDTLIIVQDVFWIGFYARTQDLPASGASYFLGDTAGSGYSYYSDDGISWTVNLESDYIIRSRVYGPEGVILLLNEDKHIYEFTPNYKDISVKIEHYNTQFYFNILSETELYSMKINIIDIKTGRSIYNFQKSLNSYMDNIVFDIQHLNLKSSKYLLYIKINNHYTITHPFIMINKTIL